MSTKFAVKLSKRSATSTGTIPAASVTSTNVPSPWFCHRWYDEVSSRLKYDRDQCAKKRSRSPSPS
jgi:hypothetical protein